MEGNGKEVKAPERSSSSSASPSSSAPPWVDLPREITANILHRLGVIEILESAQKVCKTWRNACKDPSMWREIDMSNTRDVAYTYAALQSVCKNAVDRSQGQLVAINIDDFANDKLLEYIAERSGQLRCLQITSCFRMCHEGLTKAVKRFPLLEELHLFFTEISSVEVVGSSCPFLKSFSLNRLAAPEEQDINNEEAYAVAKTMPELRHLRLLGNDLSNEGLRAILDGCPHLESLDIRQCFNVNFRGELGKRCSEQLKCVRQPHDSTGDYEFDPHTYEDDPYANYVSGISESSNDGYDYEY